MGLLKNLETLFIKIAVNLITAYQRTLSPDHGPRQSPTCRFTPTCSVYTKTAIEKFGVLGVFLGAWHIVRCNPLMTKVHTHEEVPEVIKIGNIIIRKRNI